MPTLITDSQASATRKKAVLVLVIVVGVIVAAVLALRPSASDPKTSGGSNGVASSVGTPTVGDLRSGSGSAANGAAVNGSSEGAGSATGGHVETSPGVASGPAVDMTQVLLEAKIVDRARAALAAGNAKKALEEIEYYEKIPNRSALRQEATVLKIQALIQVGRKTDARSLAYATRDDPAFNSYRSRIEGILADGG